MSVLALLILCILLNGLAPGAASASPWTLPRGDFYAYGGFFWTRSQDFFNAEAQRDAFLNEGTTRLYGFAAEGAYGLRDRLMLSASLPVIWYELQDNFIRDAGHSPGDLRMAIRWRALEGPVAFALESGVKLPTATAKDPTRARVGEGQRDFELSGSLGRFFPTAGLRLSVDAGYRWRQRDKETGFKPGDEVIYRLELGYRANSRLGVNAFIEGFDGERGNARVFDLIAPARQERRLIALTPNLAYRLDRNFELQLSASVPLAGKRFYAGKQFVVGIAYNRESLNRAPGAGGFSSPGGGGCCAIQ